MVKTQVQIPDELYRRAKQVAAEKEWSFAEVVRRGLECITQVNPPGRASAAEWELPPARPCGPFLAPPDRWTELAHEL
jgi:hypothetical protein